MARQDGIRSEQRIHWECYTLKNNWEAFKVNWELMEKKIRENPSHSYSLFITSQSHCAQIFQHSTTSICIYAPNSNAWQNITVTIALFPSILWDALTILYNAILLQRSSLFFNITIRYNNNNELVNPKPDSRTEKPSENDCCSQLLNLALHIWPWHYSPTLFNQNACFCPPECLAECFKVSLHALKFCLPPSKKLVFSFSIHVQQHNINSWIMLCAYTFFLIFEHCTIACWYLPHSISLRIGITNGV